MDGAARQLQLARVRTVRHEVRKVQHFEHALEGHERRHQVDPRVRERHQRRIELAHERHHRDDVTDAEETLRGERPADPVDDRTPEGGDEPEEEVEGARVDGDPDAHVADARRLRAERVAFDVRAPEELGEHRAGHVEALLHRRVHVRVEVHLVARQVLKPPSDALRRQEEQREDDEREERDLPGQQDHRHDRDPERDRALHHRAERVRDGALRPDHVVVQPADQGAGLRPREEGDRHPLDVVEELHAQIEDESFADARGEVPGGQTRARDEDGEHDAGDRVPPDEVAAPRDDRRVDQRPDEQRRGDAEERRPDEHDEVRRDRDAVARREAERARDRPGRELVALRDVVTAEATVHPAHASASATWSHGVIVAPMSVA